MRDSPPSERDTRKVVGENEESKLPAFFVSLFTCSFRFATVIHERHWPRIRENKTWRSTCSSEEARNSLF